MITLEHKEVFRDIKIKLKEAEESRMIIPDSVYEIIDNLEKEYEEN